MTYIIIKLGDETAMFANADCYVKVLLDWLRTKVSHLLPPRPAELDLCDDAGVVRLLSELPPTTSGTMTLQIRGIYHPVVRFITQVNSFRLLQPPQATDKQRELQQRIAKCCTTWERYKQKLPKEPSFEKLLEAIQKSITRSSKGPANESLDRTRDRSGSAKGRKSSSRYESLSAERRSTHGSRHSLSLDPGRNLDFAGLNRRRVSSRLH